MQGYRTAEQTPPPAQRITDIVVMRHDHIYEVDPDLMTEHVEQQHIPAWDMLRMVDSRLEWLYMLQAHFSDERVSGEELLAEIEAEEASHR
jgi:hypothetical protein